MNSLLKFKQTLFLCVLVLLMHELFAQQKLPESVFGEWYNESGTGEYSGVLIHPEFIEFGYRPFVYQEIEKSGDNAFSFWAKDALENTLKVELTIIGKSSIRLKRGNSPESIYNLRDLPIEGERVSLATVPSAIKNTWYTLDGNNALEFDLLDDKFIFRNKSYTVDEVIKFSSNGKEQYRFIVKNGKDYKMFYFKNWDKNYLQIGFNGKAGAVYKAKEEYPDFRIDNLEGDSSSVVSNLPSSLYGEWFNQSGTGEYSGVLIHPEFIEYGYRPFVYQKITKSGNNAFSFWAKDELQNTLKVGVTIMGKDSILLKRGNAPEAVYTLRDLPIEGERVSLETVPSVIKSNWFTLDGNNTLEFSLLEDKFVFRNKPYMVEEIIKFTSNGSEQYRFIVKNDKDYKMFYFKNWNKNYLQIGFNGKAGDVYKAKEEYPDFRMDDLEGYLASKVPMELRGNWLKADGSNLWSHSLYYNYAIIDKDIWNYKKVKQKGKKYVLILEKGGEEKSVYAEIQSDSIINFGTNKKNLVTRRLTKINNPEFKSEVQETDIAENILNHGIATYSGIIRNFDESKGKTGTVSVNNVFTGKQDSYLINIQEDGSFSVSFPCYHLQQVFVRLPAMYNTIYVEPGKTTWQLVNSSDRSEGYFAGDLAQLNTDFSSLSFLVFTPELANLQSQADQLELNDYKEACYKVIENQKKQLDSVYKTRFLSETAYKLMKLELECRLYEVTLSYDIFRNTPYSEATGMNQEYIDFITPEVLNNEHAILTSSYDSFINRLRYLRFLRNEISVKHPNVEELGTLLRAQGVELTSEEEALVELHINYYEDNEEALKKQKDFNEANKEVQQSFVKTLSEIYNQLSEEERKQAFTKNQQLNIEAIEKIVKNKKINLAFTDEEKAYYKSMLSLLSEDELEMIKSIHTNDMVERNAAFTQKYKTYTDKYVQNELRKKGLQNIRENFGSNFCSDVMVAQVILGSLSNNYTPLTNEELIEAESFVEDSFIKTVFKIENDALKAKIEANKLKTDYVNNDVPDTEADKVFDAIISKYKGKVVFVDFWATWCGPCRSGMERIKPLKEELKDKDVAFVYITNPSSPEHTYNNMIPDIKGEHYRVSEDEWNYLKSKFNITGIPHYLLIDKDGSIVKRNTSDLRMPNTVKPLFEKYLQ